MSGLISRKEAIKAVKFYETFCDPYPRVIESLEELPSVQPEIIRCKDCKWWDKQEMSLQGRCSLLQMYPTGGWYCGNAKLRGDSDE